VIDVGKYGVPEPAKRKVGRPKGSKNKARMDPAFRRQKPVSITSTTLAAVVAQTPELAREMVESGEYKIPDTPEYAESALAHYMKLLTTPNEATVGGMSWVTPSAEAATFVRWLCTRHGQGVSLVLNRLVLAAKYGIPYYIPDKITAKAKAGLDYLESKRQINRMALLMKERHTRKEHLKKVLGRHGKPELLGDEK
jgi:ABC-type Fe3+ transport system substrate-binding protein